MKKLLLAIICLVGVSFAGSYDRSDWIKPSQWAKARKHTLDRQRIGNFWICEYSLDTIRQSRQLDIDHIVPLKYAQEHGGDKFTSDQKHAFATDDSNLVAVNEHENRAKGDKGVLQYMPPNNQCFYLRHWYYMTNKFKLTISPEESGYIQRGLKGCNDPILNKKF